VVAEGVEDEDEWALVASLGVDIVQGYYIAKPMDAQGIENWVVNWSAAE
jgi:EAL domain-containing protein (putative c-di-GMP-specific phosphodiesterase class I)